jgi:hypothetical protein
MPGPIAVRTIIDAANRCPANRRGRLTTCRSREGFAWRTAIKKRRLGVVGRHLADVEQRNPRAVGVSDRSLAASTTPRGIPLDIGCTIN